MIRNAERLIRTILGVGLVLGFAHDAGAEEKKGEKIDGKLLVGKWQQVKPVSGPQVTIEFTADGKVSSSVETGDGKSQQFNGTYALTGSKLVMVFTVGDIRIEGSGKVNKLTKDAFETTDRFGVTLDTRRVPKK